MLDKLREANIARQQQWETAEEFSVVYMSNALAGETGEVCNAVKKLERERLGAKGSRATIEDVAKELADVIIYADLLAIKLGIDLQEAVRWKFNEVSARHGFAVYLSTDNKVVGTAPAG